MVSFMLLLVKKKFLLHRKVRKKINFHVICTLICHVNLL